MLQGRSDVNFDEELVEYEVVYELLPEEELVDSIRFKSNLFDSIQIRLFLIEFIRLVFSNFSMV